VQSLRDRDLAALGRRHDRAQVVRAVERLRRAGCANLSLDLIGGLPGQDRAAWRAILGRACELQPDHLSVYLLEVDPDQARHHPVLQRLPPDDQVARHYQLAVELLEARGYAQYEISNFARPGRASRHNLKYWTDAPYAGFGPAAHGYDGRRRHWNYADLAAYRAAVLAGRPPVAGAEEIGAQRRAQDALMLGLRLNHGLDLLRFEQRYGWRAPVAVIERLARAGLVVLEGDRLLLTLRGRLLSNSVLAELALDPGGCNEPAEGRRLGRRRPSQDAWATS
jgi:oxygen-independent coproporphyrinogen-3 oxidase